MHCRACAAPLNDPKFKGPSPDYCKYCADDNGKPKPRGEVQRNIAGWLASWDPGLSEKDASSAGDEAQLSMCREVISWLASPWIGHGIVSAAMEVGASVTSAVKPLQTTTSPLRIAPATTPLANAAATLMHSF